MERPLCQLLAPFYWALEYALPRMSCIAHWSFIVAGSWWYSQMDLIYHHTSGPNQRGWTELHLKQRFCKGFTFFELRLRIFIGPPCRALRWSLCTRYLESIWTSLDTSYSYFVKANCYVVLGSRRVNRCLIVWGTTFPFPLIVRIFVRTWIRAMRCWARSQNLPWIARAFSPQLSMEDLQSLQLPSKKCLASLTGILITYLVLAS